MTEVIAATPRAVNLRQDELDELTPQQIKAWRAEIDRQMYGDKDGNVLRDRKGRPIEQGLGSRGHETRQCLNAMKGPYGIPRDDPRRDEILAEYEARLLETEARRAAERGGQVEDADEI
jgi:hypothetical protein